MLTRAAWIFILRCWCHTPTSGTDSILKPISMELCLWPNAFTNIRGKPYFDSMPRNKFLFAFCVEFVCIIYVPSWCAGQLSVAMLSTGIGHVEWMVWYGTGFKRRCEKLINEITTKKNYLKNGSKKWCLRIVLYEKMSLFMCIDCLVFSLITSNQYHVVVAPL